MRTWLTTSQRFLVAAFAGHAMRAGYSVEFDIQPERESVHCDAPTASLPSYQLMVEPDDSDTPHATLVTLPDGQERAVFWCQGGRWGFRLRRQDGTGRLSFPAGDVEMQSLFTEQPEELVSWPVAIPTAQPARHRPTSQPA